MVQVEAPSVHRPSLNLMQFILGGGGAKEEIERSKAQIRVEEGFLNVSTFDQTCGNFETSPHNSFAFLNLKLYLFNLQIIESLYFILLNLMYLFV